MTNEELRQKTVSNMDNLLSYRLVRGEERAILSAFRTYVETEMPTDQLDRVLAFMPVGDIEKLEGGTK